MSTTFALTSASASALETPVIVIDTCIVGGDFDHFSYSSSSPFTPSFSSLSSSSPQSSVSNFLNIPRFFMMTSPSTRNLRVHRRNAIPTSPLTPVNSPASPEVRDIYLGVPDFGVGSPSVRCKGWSSSSSSSECKSECDGEGAGRGRGELVMSPIAPPNTPCSPLVLGRLDRGSKDEGGEDCEVLILSESESKSESEEFVDNFRNPSGYSMRERVFGDIPQIVVGCEEEGWGQLGVDAGMDVGCIVESWEMEIQLRN
ncbi:uncharacterized protein Bfra_012224 [Botrytis fragariae]|uniref:Uncharacterized protein n=1 Tax=Botrytis fragariae TaxID=1964551 RepID=A0A8H6EDS1_9HELO|nr:uncharacterized protein Bfra_012224 [Botrytis fragariae]KAF5868577.1 hypothetical protein Bfra_012224 [Botrytis fragariae]